MERRKNDMPHQRTHGRMRARIQGGNRKRKGGRELERCDIFTFRIFRSFFSKRTQKIFKLRNEFQEFVIYLNLEFVFIFKDIHFKEQKCE